MRVTSKELTGKHCTPCEGGVPPLSAGQVREHLDAVPGWQAAADGKRITRSWRVKDFATALDFFRRIAQIAEAEDHHPDLHLVGYRNVTVELHTHAVGALA